MAACQRCGSPLAGAESYCAACGAPVPPAAPAQPAPRRRRFPLVWLLLGIGCLGTVGVGLVVVALAGGYVYYAQRGAPPSSEARGSGDADAAKGRQYLALRAADDFRIQGTDDFFRGLKQYGREAAVVRFFAIGDELWPFADETLGWAYFFNSCVIVSPPAQGERAPVGFYHPYSDVLLLTMWSVSKEEGPRIEDVEVFMGDFLRRRGEPPFAAERPWRKTDAYRPAAMLESTKLTVDAFERAFLGSAAQSDRWRAAIPGASNAPLVADNLTGAAMLLTKNFSELRAYHHEGNEDPALADVRTQVGRFIEHRGLVDLPDARTARRIQELPEAAWKTLRVVSYSSSKKQRLVTLAIAASPDRSISLLFDVHGRIVTLARADLLSYSAFIAGSKGTP